MLLLTLGKKNLIQYKNIKDTEVVITVVKLKLVN